MFFIAISVSSFSSAAGFKGTATKVVFGDSVYSILKRHGFNDNQRKAALSQVRLPKDFVLAPGDIYYVDRSQQGRRAELRFFSNKLPVFYSFVREGYERASAQAVSITFDKKVVSVQGRVRGSLVESIAGVIGDELLAYRFMDAFVLDYNLPRVLQKNAPFSMQYERLYYKGQFVRFGEVLKAEVEVLGRTASRIFKGLKDGGGVFLNPDSNHADRPFFSPVNYIRISSLFQPRRFHPIKKFRRAHEGIDFELPEGDAIYSIAPATVIRVGKNRAAGNFVVLRHRGGYESYYNHMSQVERLRPGQNLGAGARLGAIGCTGYCTKPHLHFAIKRHGRFINPISLVRSYSYHQKGDVERFVASF